MGKHSCLWLALEDHKRGQSGDYGREWIAVASFWCVDLAMLIRHPSKHHKGHWNYKCVVKHWGPT